MTDDLRSGKGICKQQVPWSDLPSPVLERIYYFLKRSDRVSMSLVCRKWGEEFNSPTLWENYRLIWIDDNKHIDPLTIMHRDPWEHPDIKFVQKYSKMIKHVHIDICIREQFSDSVLEYWFESFKKFLRVFSQLESVNFRGLSYFCYQKIDEYMEFPIYNESCQAIANFLGSQSHLKRLEFHDCAFEYEDVAELLSKSLENSKESLRILVLDNIIDYFDDDKRDPKDVQILPKIFFFPKLTTLAVDYWLVFGTQKAVLSDVLKKFKNCQKQTVLKILTVVDENVDFEKFKLLQSSDWRYLKEQYPHLDVEIKVERFPAYTQPPEVFIVKDMPVTRLEYHFYDWCPLTQCYPMEIETFLGYLLDCKINHHLVSFNLSWAKPISNLASVFIPFLYSCKKLQHLDLSTVYPPNHLGTLLGSLLMIRHESLREFKLTIYDTRNRSDIAILKTVISEFDVHFKLARIHLEVDIHL